MPQKWWDTGTPTPPPAPPSAPQAPAWWSTDVDAGAEPSDPSIAFPEPDSGDSMPLWKRILAGGLRSGGGLIGGVLGAAGGELLEPLGGGIPGAIAGKGAGGAFGEYLAEKLEGRDTNPLEVAGNAAISMVPFGKEASMAASAAKGALLGGADTGYREVAEGGSLDPEEIAKSAALGGATAGIIHRVTGGGLKTPSGESPIPSGKLTPGDVHFQEGPFGPRDINADVHTSLGANPDEITGGTGKWWSRSTQVQAPPPGSGVPATTPLQSSADIARRTFGFGPAENLGPGLTADEANAIAPQEETLIPSGPRSPAEIIRNTFGLGSRARTILPPLETPPPVPSGEPLTGFGFGMPRAEDQASLDFLDPELAPTQVNGSGDSAASIEALNRANAMREAGQQFVKFDRAGTRSPLIGPDAVDYFPREGETTAVEGPNGELTIRDDNGGRVPAQNPATEHFLRPFNKLMEPPEGGNGRGPDEPYNLSEFEPPPGTRTSTALTPKRPMLPADFVSVWRDLQERGADQVARQAGDEIPFTVDPREGLATFAKRVSESDPRDLMNLERQAKAMLPEDSGEAGFVDPAAIAAGSKKIASEGLDAAERYRYFSLFSNPLIAAKKALGDTSNAAGEALEQALSGDPQKAARILKSFFSPQTLQDVGTEFKNAGAQAGEEGFGRIQGALGLPSRVLAAITNAAKNAHARAGLSPEEAKNLTFTGSPKIKDLNRLVNFQAGSGPAVKIAMPVARVAANIFERGLERTPGLGFMVPGALDNLKLALVRQGLGAGAGLAGYEMYDPNDKSSTHSLTGAAFGRYSLPFVIGQALAAAQRHPTSKVPVYDRVSDAIFNTLPFGEAMDYRPSRVLKQLTPWFLRDSGTPKH